MSNTITINVLGNTRQFQQSVKGVQNDLGRLGTASQKAGSFLKSSLKVAGLGAAAAGVAMAKFGKDSITAASDLNETMSKTKTIFGEASPAIMAFGRNAASSLGLSTNEALTGVSTFGNFFDQIGIGTQKSAEMSKQFVKMSADLGSFHNAAPVDVMDALAGATRGEYDALQKYIPTINAAAVQNKAMAMTGKDSASALTDAEKAAALYQLAIKGQGKAQGDFARTSGSLANQQKILAAQFENVKAKIGTALMPIVKELMGYILKEGVPALNKFAAWFKQEGPAAIASAVGAFKTFLGIVKPIAKFVAENAGLILKLVAAFYAVVGVIALVNAAVSAYKTIMTVIRVATIVWRNAQLALNLAMMLNPVGLVIAAIVALVAIFVIAYKKSETFRKIVDKAWAGIKKATKAVWEFCKDLTLKVWNAIKDAATKAAKAVKDGVSKAWNAVKSATSKVWNAVKKVVLAVWNFFKAAVKTYFNAYKAVITAVWNAVKKVTTTVWNAVKNFIVNAWQTIKSRVSNAVRAVKDAISNAWDAARDATRRVWDAIKSVVVNAISNLIDKVRGIRSKIIGAFAGAGSWLLSAGADLVRGLINGIKNMAGAAVSAAKSVVSGAINGAKALLGINSPSKVFRDFGRYTVEGLVIGLNEKAGKAAQASGDLARQVAKGFEAPRLTLNAQTPLAAGGGTGGTTINLNVSVPPTANPAATGREIQKVLDEYHKTGGIRRA